MAEVEAEPTPAPPVAQASPGPTFSAPKQGSARTIATLMVVATGASLVSHETNVKGIADTVGGAKIIFGFTAATVTLILIAQAGDAAAEFAKGLAVITLASSLIANGSVLAKVMTNLSSGSPSAPSKATVTKTTTAAKKAA